MENCEVHTFSGYYQGRLVSGWQRTAAAAAKGIVAAITTSRRHGFQIDIADLFHESWSHSRAEFCEALIDGHSSPVDLVRMLLRRMALRAGLLTRLLLPMAH
jgi:hypothetical protein